MAVVPCRASSVNSTNPNSVPDNDTPTDSGSGIPVAMQNIFWLSTCLARLVCHPAEFGRALA